MRETRQIGLSAWEVWFILAHIPLGILAAQRSALLTFHAWGMLLAGGVWLLFGRYRRPVVLLYWAGYIAGAEVLWRLARARVFWEFGKYATVALVGAFLVRHISSHRLPRMSRALLYLILLLPSATLTVAGSPIVREDLSFNLSGPLSLALCAWVFATVRVSLKDMRRIALAVVAPTAAIGAAALYTTLTHREVLAFTLESNRLTSGGFGPNQVSAALGLGALFALLRVIMARSRRERLLFLGLGLWLLAQAALTFSRGGVLNAVLALALIGSQYIRHPRYRGATMMLIAALFLVGNFVLLPWLNRFTGGALVARFAELDTTNRIEIMTADLALFREHPFTGVGPGMAKYARTSILGYGTAAHTEFTRLVAEHGVLGVLAFVLLITLGLRAFFMARTPLTRGLVLAFLAWSFAEMAHSAMRIVAISYLFGLTQVHWEEEEEAVETPARASRRQLSFRRRVLPRGV